MFTCISFVSWLVGCTPVHAATSKESLWCVAQQVWDKDTTTSDDLIGMARCNLMDIVTGLELPLLSPAVDQAVPTADAPGATRTASDGKEHGRLVIEKQSVEFRYFTIGSKIKPALLRYYVEQVWRLPAPEVVISIASACGQQGGYGLDTAIEDKVLLHFHLIPCGRVSVRPCLPACMHACMRACTPFALHGQLCHLALESAV